MAVAIYDRDALHLRQRVVDQLEPGAQRSFVAPDVVVRHATNDFVDLGKGALDGLQHLERVLVQDVERAVNALIGHVFEVAVAYRRGEREQHRRQY